MTSGLSEQQLIEKIGTFESIVILVNEKTEMEFEGIIDAPYIKMHFNRVINSCRDFDIVKLIGSNGNKRKELIEEVIVSKD